MPSKEFDSSFSYMPASVKLYQVYSHIPRKHLMTKGNTVWEKIWKKDWNTLLLGQGTKRDMPASNTCPRIEALLWNSHGGCGSPWQWKLHTHQWAKDNPGRQALRVSWYFCYFSKTARLLFPRRFSFALVHSLKYYKFKVRHHYWRLASKGLIY